MNTQQNDPRINQHKWFGHRLLILLAIVATVAALTACSSTRSTGSQFDDAAITTSITGKFAADPEINPFNIDVDTNERRVRLSGTVDDQQTKDEAERLARKTKGVLSVDNDIEIGNKSMGETISDASIVTKVKALLAADPDINPFNIDVDSSNGEVTLTGRVASRDASQEAVRLAKTVKGVKDVDNKIKVGDLDP